MYSLDQNEKFISGVRGMKQRSEEKMQSSTLDGDLCPTVPRLIPDKDG
jgi:hypothetical protein